MGSRLFVVRGRATQVLPQLIREWGVTRLTFGADCEPAGRQRDAALEAMVSKLGVEVISHNSHLLYDTQDVREASGGNVPLERQQFFELVKALGRPRAPDQPVDRSMIHASAPSSKDQSSSQFDVPRLTEFGVKDESVATARRFWKGGETEGLRRMDVTLKTVRTYAPRWCENSVNRWPEYI
jgi:cryptochrome